MIRNDMKSTKTKAPIISNNSNLQEIIGMEAGEDVIKFISEQVDLTKDTSIYLSSNRTTPKNTENHDIRTFIDLQTLNRQGNLNAYFRSINDKLPDAGIYIGCLESYTERK